MKCIYYPLLILAWSAFLLLVAITPTNAQTPPPTWQEKWFEHNQLLQRVYYDDEVAVYFDDDVDRDITWMNSYLGDVWRYTKSVYGDFSDEGRLYAVFHTGRYSGGHPATYFDDSHDNRDMIDVGPGNWKCGCNNDLDIVTHEVAHIVEGASLGVKGSPAFGIWKDSKWAEIFNYDVYQALGMKKDQKRWYDLMMKQTDDFPRPGTQWFKNWFFPLYDQYGETKVLANFFQLLAENYPTGGTSYSKGMNWGEFVHFWSAAAKTNLKPLATEAFGWPTEWEQQFRQARRDFPLSYGDQPDQPKPEPDGIVTLYQDCDFGGKAVSLSEGEHPLDKLRSLGVVNDDVSSLRVKEGYRITVYQDDNFQGRSLSFTQDEACLNEENFNDELSSVKVSKQEDQPEPPRGEGQLVQAEDYSNMKGVQTEKTEDEGGGLNVGYLDKGDKLTYQDVRLTTGGTYTIEYRVASRRGDSFVMLANGESLGTVEIPRIGGWQDWRTIEQTVSLEVGTYTFTILANSGEWNINWWRISPQDGTPEPPATGTVALYEDCEFGGKTVKLQEGRYTRAQLQAKGLGESQLSSLRVPDDYQVTLYAADNFQGASLALNKDVACLVDSDWNDRTSSLVITPCQFTNVTPQVSVNGGKPRPTNNVTVEAGANVVLDPRASGQGSWQWTGPQNFRSDTRQVTLKKFAAKQSGQYVVTFTNQNGCITEQTYELRLRGNERWANFVYPTVIYQDEATGTRGSDIVKTALPNIRAVMRATCLDVCKQIYENNNDRRVSFSELTLRLEDTDGVAYKTGSPGKILIGVSARHLANVYRNNGNDYKAVAKEIRGILSHEATHGYQWNPKGAGGYQNGTDAYGFIEGLADYVRINTTGFQPERFPSPGGNWTDGYTTSGFFLDWITDNKDPDFAIKFNQAARDYDTWSWDKACRAIVGESVQSLWNQYQASLRDDQTAQAETGAQLLYPNPAQRIVNVQAARGQAVRSVAVMDGADVQQHLPVIRDQGEQIDVSRLPKGVHLLMIEGADGHQAYQRLYKR